MKGNLSLAGIVGALLLLALFVVSVVAQTGNGYDLTWHTVDGGGVSFAAGNGYELGGTVGQPDVGVLRGGGYELAGGLWVGGIGAGSHKVYLPLVLRGH